MNYPRIDACGEDETVHGRRLPNPYAALEGPEIGKAARWTAEQQRLTDAFFAAGPEQAQIQAWLEGFLDRPYVFHTLDTPSRRFTLESRPDAEQPVLLAEGEPIVEVAPGQVLMQEAIYPSPAGRFVAYAVKPGVGDFARLKLWGAEAPDFPETVLPCVAWTPDESSFFYNQNQGAFIEDADRAARPDGIWRHVLGTRVEQDRLIFPMRWPEAHVAIPTVSADGRFLFVNLVQLVANTGQLWVVPLDGSRDPVLLGEAGFCPIGERGDLAYFETNLDAPDGRIVAFDLSDLSRVRMSEVVAEQRTPLARSTRNVRPERSAIVGDRLVLTRLDGAGHRVALHDLDGRWLRDLKLPPASSVAGGGGDRYGRLGAARDGRLILDLWTFAEPPTSWLYDLESDTLAAVAPDRRPRGFDRVVIERTTYPADDGTPIPITLLSLAPIPSDGSGACLLYGYGGAGMPITPEFQLDVVGWLALGGVWAIANIRGGGEFGRAWHEPARGPNKTLTFDDFCAGARWLIERGVTRRERLAIRGISYGGLLTGACLTRRPDLFGAVIAEIPLLDPLRAGRTFWSAQLAPELGDPTADPEAYDAIARYSPLQNLKPGQPYPPTFVLLADGDAQLLTDGGRKFVATLQADPAHGGPHLLHILRGAAHGGWSRSQQIEAMSRELAFLVRVLDAGLSLKP